MKLSCKWDCINKLINKSPLTDSCPSCVPHPRRIECMPLFLFLNNTVFTHFLAKWNEIKKKDCMNIWQKFLIVSFPGLYLIHFYITKDKMMSCCHLLRDAQTLACSWRADATLRGYIKSPRATRPGVLKAQNGVSDANIRGTISRRPHTGCQILHMFPTL